MDLITFFNDDFDVVIQQNGALYILSSGTVTFWLYSYRNLPDGNKDYRGLKDISWF